MLLNGALDSNPLGGTHALGLFFVYLIEIHIHLEGIVRKIKT
jgi:hypothetical protein